MARPRSPDEEMLSRFDERVEILLGEALSGTVPLFTWIQAKEAISQKLSLGYVDLAVRSPTHVHWRKRLWSMYLHNLPHLCMEHMLAEKVSVLQTVPSVYDYMVNYNSVVLDLFCELLNMFNKSWFNLFETAILEKLPTLDDVQKAQRIRRYLKFLKRSTFGVYERLESVFPTLLEHSTYLNAGITMNILDAFCYTRSAKVWLFSLVPNVNCLIRLILQAKAVGFDFWGLWSGKGNLELNLMVLKQETSQVLLQYDFPYTTNQTTFLWRCNTVNNIRVRDLAIIQSIDVFIQHADDSEKRPRMMLILDIFITFGNFDITTNFNDRVNTLLYLTRTLPLPYVTTRELYETMLKAVVPEFQNDLKEIVFKYSNIDIFEDDVSDPIMPRRLMHLCRVAIRRVLADNFVHVDGIDQLRLPRLLKEYLRLEK